MYGFLSKWRLYCTWPTFICLLGVVQIFADASCRQGTTMLQADDTPRLLSFPSDRTDDYPSYCKQEWRITTTSGVYVQLSIFVLDIEGSLETDCVYDSLSIYDGGYTFSNKRLAKLCGSLDSRSLNISSRSSEILLIFDSDGSIQKRGFQLYYVNEGGRQNQDGVTNFTATVNDKYLTYPDGNYISYPTNADVKWRIATPSPNERLEIYIVRQDIEDGPSCAYDSLTIYDGYDSDATVLKKLCGRLDTLHRTFTSSTHFLFLHFTSDSSGTGRGFKLGYSVGKSETACSSDENDVITLSASEEDNELTSPNFPGPYPSDCRVQWRIISTRERVRFGVQALDIEEKADCGYDYLAFYDGYEDSARLLKKICGNPTPDKHTFVSTSDNVFVRFISDGSGGGHGFLIYFKAEDEADHPIASGDDSSHTDNSAVVVGVIFGVICFVLLVAGFVFAIVRKTRNEQRRQRSQQPPADPRLMYPSTPVTATTSGGPTSGFYLISPSAPPLPYATLNHAYIPDQPPPSYSEANQWTIDPSEPPIYSSAMLGNVTAGPTNPAVLPALDVMAAFKEQDEHIQTAEPVVGTNIENQGTNLSQASNSGQEANPNVGPLNGYPQLYDHSQPHGHPQLYDHSQPHGHPQLYDASQPRGHPQLYDDSQPHGHPQLYDDSQPHGHPAQEPNQEP